MKPTSYIVSILLSSLALVIIGQSLPSAVADSVPLLKIKTDNSKLKLQLPKFYSCISSEVSHSKGKQSDPYFKTEPTKNEVLKCYYKVLAGQDEKKLSHKS